MIGNVTIIAAQNAHGVIGVKNQIPWKIPSEMKFFKETTTGHPVIMGRNTWESLPKQFRPLPDRINIVLTSDDSMHSYPEGVFVESNMEDAIRYVRRCGNGKEIFVIGGGEVYAHALSHNLVNKVLLSVVKGYNDITEGVKFPDLKKYGWTPTLLRDEEDFTLYQYDPILTFDKISEIAMDLSLKLTDMGISGYEYNECMNCLRSRLVESFAMNSVAHDRTTMGRVDWLKLREERRNAQKG